MSLKHKSMRLENKSMSLTHEPSSTGVLLASTRRESDFSFGGSVVLLTQHDETGHEPHLWGYNPV